MYRQRVGTSPDIVGNISMILIKGEGVKNPFFCNVTVDSSKGLSLWYFLCSSEPSPYENYAISLKNYASGV